MYEIVFKLLASHCNYTAFYFLHISQVLRCFHSVSLSITESRKACQFVATTVITVLLLVVVGNLVRFRIVFA